MSTQTIRVAQFMYYVETGRVRTLKNGDEQEILSVRHALRGDTVDIPREEDVERGERAGAFVAVVEDTESGPDEMEEVDSGPDFSSHDTLVEWFEEERPTAREVVAAAEGNADKADMLLDAEETSTGGHSRKAVVTGLNKIIDAAEAEEDTEDTEED